MRWATCHAALRRAARVPAISFFILANVLCGCAMSERGAAPVLYDFGDRPLAEVTVAKGAALPSLAASVQSSSALDSTAMLYRLNYADARQLRAYAQARWAMPPAELLQQRLTEVLSQQRAVLKPGEGGQLLLQVELDEFSQVFDSPEQSSGLLRLRATVLRATPGGDRLLAQRSWRVQRPASSSGGAAGGVRALSAATDVAVTELAQWLEPLR